MSVLVRPEAQSLDVFPGGLVARPRRGEPLLRVTPQPCGARICLCPGLSACTPYSIRRRRWLSACVFAQTRASGTGMLACCPSAAPFGLALGADSPRADEPGPGNLGIPASGILTPIFVTHVRIITPKRSSGPSGPPSTLLGTLFYHASEMHPRLRQEA